MRVARDTTQDIQSATYDHRVLFPITSLSDFSSLLCQYPYKKEERGNQTLQPTTVEPWKNGHATALCTEAKTGQIHFPQRPDLLQNDSPDRKVVI